MRIPASLKKEIEDHYAPLIKNKSYTTREAFKEVVEFMNDLMQIIVDNVDEAPQLIGNLQLKRKYGFELLKWMGD